MLFNFITVSISYEKRENGNLRAVGARSNDAFKIFFSESFIISLINAVLSIIVTIIFVVWFNDMQRKVSYQYHKYHKTLLMCYNYIKDISVEEKSMKYYSSKKVTEILGVTAQTLRNWDKEDKLKPAYTKSNK